MTTLDTRDGLSIELNGVKYEIDLSRYRRQTIEATRAQQDQSSESSEQTLNNQYLWKRSGEDFGLGSNQKWFDSDPTDSRKRFFDSLNVDVWDDREAKLLFKLDNKLPGTLRTIGALAGQPSPIANSWISNLGSNIIVARNFRNDISELPIDFTVAVVNDPTTNPYTLTTVLQSGSTYGTFSPPVSSIITSFIQDGSNFYGTISGYNKVWKFTYTGGPITPTAIGAAYVYSDLFSVAGQIFARRADATNVQLVRITDTTDIVIDEWPLARAPKLTGAVAGPDGIYWSGILSITGSLTTFRNTKSQIFRSKFNETISEWDNLSPVTALPEGEAVTALNEYAGYLLIGSSKGFRLGQFTQTGGINYGPLNALTDFSGYYGNAYDDTTKSFNIGVTKFEAEGNFVWFNYAGYKPQLDAFDDKVYFGLGRIDLSQLVDELQPAWSTDLMQYDTLENDNPTYFASSVQSFHSYLGRFIFSTTFSGIWAEKADVYATTGYLNTGKINFGTAELKRFARAEIKGQVTNSSADKITYTVIAEDVNSTNQIGVYGNGNTDTAIYLTDSYGEYAEVEFKLESSSAGVYSPILNRWTLRALPLPERQEEIFLPIIIKDNVTHSFLTSVSLDGYEEFADIRALLQSRVIVPLVMGDESLSVIVDSIITGQDQGVKLDRWNSNESWPDGIWYVRCITIQDTAVSPVAVHTIAAATVTAGTATSLPVNSNPTVTNSGTSSAAVFDFGIPVGATGSTGATGAPGIETSATAPINTSILWADTMTTGAAGTVPSGGTIGQVLAKNSGTNYDTEWASVGSAARPLLTSGAYLSGSGLVLGGITANNASTPDSAALDITGDIDIQCKVSLDDWTPASEAPLVSKFGGSLYAYELRIASTGKPYLRWTSDGATLVSQIPTAVPSVTDGQTIWVRATRNATTGTATFYTSPDGATWTQLGAPVAGAAGSIYSSVNPLFVGARTAALESCSGTIYRAIVKDGITGATVFDADFSTQTADALAFTATCDMGIKADGLVLRGVAGQYASAPDFAAARPTGDMELIVEVSATDWTPSLASVLALSGTNMGGGTNWYLYLDTNGTLVFSRYGVGSRVFTSTVATGLTDGTDQFIKVTFDQDNGSSQSEVRFYISADGVTFTQLGAAITNADVGVGASNTTGYRIGATNTGTFPFIGTIHRVIVKNGIAGTTVFDAVFDAQAPGTISFVESSSSAATVTVNVTQPTVTINTTRYSYGLPNTQSGSISTGTLTLGNDRYQRFVVTRPIVVDMALIEVTAGPASAATVYFGLYAANDNWQPTGNVLLATDLAVGTSATGVFTKQVTPVTLEAGTYLFATNSSVTMTVRTLVNGDAAIGPSYGSSGALLVFSRGRTAGTFGNNPNEWNTTASGSTAGQINYALLRYKAAS